MNLRFALILVVLLHQVLDIGCEDIITIDDESVGKIFVIKVKNNTLNDIN